MQWIIYDTYNDDFAEQQKILNAGAAPRTSRGPQTASRSAKSAFQKKAAQAEELNKKYMRCWQILERMINQNIFDDIGNDYRYWEDPADEYREGEGNLLPLWRFQYEKTKKMNVTEIVFNPAYYDLFAVCFGSRESRERDREREPPVLSTIISNLFSLPHTDEFLKQPNEGYLCLFTVKNPSYPDYISK